MWIYDWVLSLLVWRICYGHSRVSEIKIRNTVYGTSHTKVYKIRSFINKWAEYFVS